MSRLPFASEAGKQSTDQSTQGSESEVRQEDPSHVLDRLRRFPNLLFDALIPTPAELRRMALSGSWDSLRNYFFHLNPRPSGVIERVRRAAMSSNKRGVPCYEIRALLALLRCLFELTAPYAHHLNPYVEVRFFSEEEHHALTLAAYARRCWAVVVIPSAHKTDDVRDHRGWFFTEERRLPHL